MAMENSSGELQEPAPGKKKKPYEKPMFRCDQVFVTSALHCGKNANEGSCLLHPPLSAS
jgi:hypothetical protein